MLEDGVVVPLKRKVRSLETNLLEWRRCACTLTSDSSQLILELSDDDVDDVVLDDDGDAEGAEHIRDYAEDRDVDASRRGKCRAAIDLGSALKRIEQKRKNKTRCEIEYWDPVVSSTSSRSSSGRHVRIEELMASSARHCQQFIDQVREAERQAKRKQSIKLGAVLAAAAAAASASGGSSSHASSQQGLETQARVVRSGGSSQISPPKIKTEQFRLQRVVTSVASSSVSAKSSSGSLLGGCGALHASSLGSSGKSEEISLATTTRATAPMPHETAANGDFSPEASFHSISSSRHQHQQPTEIPSGDEQTQYWSQHCRDAHTRDCESDTLDSSSGVISPRAAPPPVTALYKDLPNETNDPINNASSLASSQVSCSSVSTVGRILLASSKPLAQELFVQRLASLRTGAQQPPQHQQQESDDDDDDESFDNRRRARMEKLFSPGSSSSNRTLRVAFQSSGRVAQQLGRRRPSIDLRAARERSVSKSPALLLRGSTRRRNSGSPASAAALAANLNRLRLPHRNNNNSHGYDDDRDRDDTAGDSSNRAELHILMRVEAALRQLEQENALAKEREALLSQEVQSLRDALRVKSAEKKHVETQLQQLTRDKDEWAQVAQRAEGVVVQLEDELLVARDELLVARDEAQLLQSERARLKHQNKELLTHVHRLDSLVYGRF